MSRFGVFAKTAQNIYHPDGLIKPDRDLTSFFTTLKLERSSAMGVAFDGLDSKEQSVSVRMKAKYKYKDHNDYKSYDGQLPPPPIMYTLNDAYWIFSSRNGGECIYSDNDFNQTVAAFISGGY